MKFALAAVPGRDRLGGRVGRPEGRRILGQAGLRAAAWDVR